jgi:hypothetical protein
MAGLTIPLLDLDISVFWPIQSTAAFQLPASVAMVFGCVRLLHSRGMARRLGEPDQRAQDGALLWDQVDCCLLFLLGVRLEKQITTHLTLHPVAAQAATVSD